MGGMWEQEWWKLRNKWISFVKQYYLQGCGVFCTLSPCLVQSSWETQAEWLRTMQEDARIYRAISIMQSPQRLIYYRAYLSQSANSHHPFFYPAWSVGLLSQDARFALQWFCYWSVLCSVLQSGCPLDDFLPPSYLHSINNFKLFCPAI